MIDTKTVQSRSGFGVPYEDRDAEIALILIGSVCSGAVEPMNSLCVRAGQASPRMPGEILLEALELASETGMASLWWVVSLDA